MKNWHIIDIPEVGSTNDEAKTYSLTAHGKKFVITAIKQNKGRGRRGRTWVGIDGNLFMSMGVEVSLAHLGQLIFVVSLALANTILNLSPDADVKLKWPNDVLVKGHKISGILLEKGEGDYIIIGIGVNIVDAPKIDNLIYPATSLREHKIITSRLEFLESYLSCFDTLWNQWQEQGFSLIRESWLNLAQGLGQEIRVVQEQTEKRGIFSGVDDNGLLLLEGNGKREKISAGDVFFK